VKREHNKAEKEHEEAKKEHEEAKKEHEIVKKEHQKEKEADEHEKEDEKEADEHEKEVEKEEDEHQKEDEKEEDERKKEDEKEGGEKGHGRTEHGVASVKSADGHSTSGRSTSSPRLEDTYRHFQSAPHAPHGAKTPSAVPRAKPYHLVKKGAMCVRSKALGTAHDVESCARKAKRTKGCFSQFMFQRDGVACVPSSTHEVSRAGDGALTTVPCPTRCACNDYWEIGGKDVYTADDCQTVDNGAFDLYKLGSASGRILCGWMATSAVTLMLLAHFTF